MSNSIKCPHCNLTNWVSDETCKRCKQPLHIVYDATPVYGGEHDYQQPNAGGYDYQPSYSTTPVYGSHPYGGYASQQNLRTGLALTSMILGIVSLPTSFFLVGLLLAPIGFILGIVGVVKANKQPRVFGGKGYAIAGIVTSCFSFFLILPIIAAIAIPNLLAARRMANEASAIRTMNTLSSAEATYRATTGAGKCGDLDSLVSVGLIVDDIIKPERAGYKYKVVMSDDVNCEVHAAPISTSSGMRSFMYSTYDGSMHAADKKGGFASYSDPTLKSNEPMFPLDERTTSTRY
jgi:hypothetical protein